MTEQQPTRRVLRAVVCPHCGLTTKVIQTATTKLMSVLCVRCDHCDRYITKDELERAYKEYSDD